MTDHKIPRLLAKSIMFHDHFHFPVTLGTLFKSEKHGYLPGEPDGSDPIVYGEALL